MSFNQRLKAANAERGSLCVGLDPIYSELPERDRAVGGVREALLAFNRRVADATAEHACAFKLQLKVYSAEGPDGLGALVDTCRYLKTAYPGHLVVLDAKYGDVGHVVARCTHEAFELCGADAVTAFGHTGSEALAPLLSRADRGCFVVCRTSNPGAAEVQDVAVEGGEPYYLYLARRASGWNAAGNCGLVVGATYPAEMEAIRTAAPALPLLVPGVGAQGGDLRASVRAAGGKDGAGLLIGVSRGIMASEDPGRAAAAYRAEIAAAESEPAAPAPARRPEIERLLVDLFDAGIIRFEPIQLKSGRISPYYHNLRALVAHPELLQRMARLFATRMSELGLECDALIGVAYAGIPLAVALGLLTGKPTGYVRAEAKVHGTRKMVEGASPGQRVLLIDDVVSDGASKLEALAPLREAGLRARDLLVFVDRGQGGMETLRDAGLVPQAVTTMAETLSVLRSAGRIDDSQVAASQEFMRG